MYVPNQNQFENQKIRKKCEKLHQNLELAGSKIGGGACTYIQD